MEGRQLDNTLNNTRHNDKRRAANEKGFTLVELMIALVLFLIVIAGIYSTFNFQQAAYMQTESHVNMVQEARAAQFFLSRDIKVAGYDPNQHLARTGFIEAKVAEVGFSVDLAGIGDPNSVEITNFALTTESGTIVDDGICPDGTTCRLSREWGSNAANLGGLQPVAEDVAAIELCYIIGNTRATTTPTNLERDMITAVIVSLLMKQPYRSNKYRNTNVYMPASGNELLTPNFRGDRSEGWGPFNDGSHRKLLVFEVQARNMTMDPYLDF
jgi:type IV pilus assembly protein PilW